MSDEEDLIERFYQGDAGALGELHERYRPRIVEAAMRRGLTREDARDVAADTFVRILGTRSSSLGSAAKPFCRLNGGRFAAWLFSIVGHLTLDNLRKRGRQVRVFNYDDLKHAGDGDSRPEIGELRPSGEPSAQERVIAGEMRGLVHASIHNLPEREQEVIWCYMDQDCDVSYAELGAALGVSETTAWRALQHAFKLLRLELEAHL